MNVNPTIINQIQHACQDDTKSCKRLNAHYLFDVKRNYILYWTVFRPKFMSLLEKQLKQSSIAKTNWCIYFTAIYLMDVYLSFYCRHLDQKTPPKSTTKEWKDLISIVDSCWDVALKLAYPQEHFICTKKRQLLVPFEMDMLRYMEWDVLITTPVYWLHICLILFKIETAQTYDATNNFYIQKAIDVIKHLVLNYPYLSYKLVGVAAFKVAFHEHIQENTGKDTIKMMQDVLEINMEDVEQVSKFDNIKNN